MPRKAKPTQPAEEQQPGLFLESDLPSLPKLIEATKQFLHTGKITCKDEERAAAIATAFMETRNILRTARRFHISPNTVKGVVKALEEAGKLDDLKQRLSDKLGLLAEIGTESLIDKVREDKVPANVLPIVVGVALDKKGMIDGDPTHRIEVTTPAPIGVDDVLGYLAAKGIQPPAIDVQSTVVRTEPTKADAPAGATALPTAPARPDGIDQAPAAGGGEGVSNAPPARERVGLNAAEFSKQKESHE